MSLKSFILTSVTATAVMIFNSCVDDNPLNSDKKIEKSDLFGRWADTVEEAGGQTVNSLAFNSDMTLLQESKVDGKLNSTSKGTWSLSEDEMLTVDMEKSGKLEYYPERKEDTLFLYPTDEKSEGSALTYVKIVVDSVGGTVVWDNFHINTFGDNGIGEENYTAQSYLGYQLGGFIDDKNDSLSWGGGFWYSYASGNGVKIFNGDSSYVVIDSAGTEPASSNDDMAQLLGDSTLTFVIDYRSLKEGSEKSSWAGVGVGLGGDVNHLDKEEGATKYEYTPSWDGAPLTTVIAWNLSELQSIHFRGSVQGPAKVHLKGMVESGDASKEVVVNFEEQGITPSTSELVPFDITVNTADLGATWDEIKERVEGLEIQLVSDDSEGEASNYLLMKMDIIELHFENEQKKFEAFPFLNITD